MSVKILIMSGGRAGEKVSLDQDEFRAGGEPGCEVFFDVSRDPSASGHSAWFHRRDEDWFVSASTGQIWLNTDLVSGARQLRSGDVVRMSEEGPDFAVSIIVAARKPATAEPEAQSSVPFPPPAVPTVPAPSASVVPPNPPSGRVSPLPHIERANTPGEPGIAPDVPAKPPVLPPTGAMPSRVASHLPILVGILAGAAVLAALLFVIFAATRRPAPPILELSPIARQTTEAGRQVRLPLRLTDPKYWDQKVHFSFASTPPAGAALHAQTGEFCWTPEKPDHYEIIVQAVALDGSRQRSDTVLAFQVTQPKPLPLQPGSSSQPGSPSLLPLKMKRIENLMGSRAVELLKLVRVGIQLESSGAGKLDYTLVESPSGARIVVQPGRDAIVEWTPQQADAGKTRVFSVRVADAMGQVASVPFSVEVRNVNTLPTDAVLLIEAEHPELSTVWAFGTGVAIAKGLVLTSAQCGCYLEDLRQKGFKAWVTHEIGPLKQEVTEVRVHARFVKLATDLKDRRYFDLAVLTVSGDLPVTAPLGKSEDMAGLTDGCPLTCLGYNFEKGQRITGFFKLADHRKAVPSELFKVLSSLNGPAEHKTFDLKSNIPENAFGSVLVNVQGRVVGIYTEPASKDLGIENLHHATAISTTILQGVGERREWVPPVVERSSDEKSKQ